MQLAKIHSFPGPIALAALAMLGLPSASASDYYAGKSIDLLIGAPPGGGYDIYARALARHYGRHIPGQPTIVAKNMPGAGSARAAGFISTVAHGTRVCVSRKDSKIKTFDDARTQKAAFGGVSTNDSTREYGYMHKKTAGAQYDVVSGYSGTAEIALAMERGEIDGACGWDWASFKSQRPDWIRDNKVNLLLQVGLEPNAELTRMGVPSVFKYVTNEADRKVVELIISQQVFQRSYIAPPGLPAEQLDALRSAFDATVRDREFLSDAETIRIDISPLPGTQVQELVAKLYAAPKDIVTRARQAINP